MFTTGSKWFFGLGAVALVLAAAYGWSTGGNRLGPVTAGYWGGVGDHLGYTILVSIALVAIFLGLVSLVIRDASPSALAELAGTETAPAAVAPAHLAHWPVVAAFGAALVTLGLAISNVLFIVGAFVILAAVVEWMVLAWSDRATGDPDTNRVVRARLLAPFEVPLAGFLVVGGVVLAISRLLLTASQTGAVAAASVLGVVILGIGAAFAAKPKISPNVVAGVLSVLAVGVVAIGVASAARGERLIEHHEEHEEEGEGNEPFLPGGTNAATTTTVAEGEG